jgi:hypothetical protein
MTRSVWFVVLLWVHSAAYSETLEVVVGNTAYSAFPDTLKKVEMALDFAGIDFNLTVLPDERALNFVTSGRYALAPMRQPGAVQDYPQLHQLLPAVTSTKVKLVVHKDEVALCDKSVDSLKELSVAGVIGSRLFDTHLYPLFKRRFAMNDAASALKMVASKRVDSTFWVFNEINVNGVTDNEAAQLHICQQRYFEFMFYSYLHKDYLHLKDRIEAAYRQVFTEP